MNSGKLSPRSNFRQFAIATVECAKDLFGESDAKIVKKSWMQVGVMEGKSESEKP